MSPRKKATGDYHRHGMVISKAAGGGWWIVVSGELVNWAMQLRTAFAWAKANERKVK